MKLLSIVCFALLFTKITLASPLSDSLVGKFRTTNCVAFPQTTTLVIQKNNENLIIKSNQDPYLTIEFRLESHMDLTLPIALRYSETLHTIRNEFFRVDADNKYNLVFENTLGRSVSGNRVHFTSYNRDSKNQKIECVFYRTK